MRWIGVEPNPFFHDRLRARGDRLGIDVDVRAATAEALPVADHSVDAVISSLVLCSVRDPAAALREVRRVLRPGGRFVFVEHVAAPHGTGLHVAQRALSPVWRALSDGCHPDRDTGRLIEAAGFAAVDLRRFRLPVPIMGPHIAGVARVVTALPLPACGERVGKGPPRNSVMDRPRSRHSTTDGHLLAFACCGLPLGAAVVLALACSSGGGDDTGGAGSGGGATAGDGGGAGASGTSGGAGNAGRRDGQRGSSAARRASAAARGGRAARAAAPTAARAAARGRRRRRRRGGRGRGRRGGRGGAGGGAAGAAAARRAAAGPAAARRARRRGGRGGSAAERCAEQRRRRPVTAGQRRSRPASRSVPTPIPATRAICTGTDPIACHFGGQPGNYDVTVVLGGAAAGNTIVQAEALRAMLGATATAAGATQRFSFTVNVRQPEGEPIQNVSAGTPGLDLYFRGNGGAPPRLDGIGYAAAASPFVIYIAGDSTVCDQTDPEYGGWGQQLPPYFNYPVSVANYADSGESSGSFLDSGSLFGAINTRLKANDWVLIQFGHNDKDVAAATFHDNMTELRDAREGQGRVPGADHAGRARDVQRQHASPRST